MPGPRPSDWPVRDTGGHVKAEAGGEQQSPGGRKRRRRALSCHTCLDADLQPPDRENKFPLLEATRCVVIC